MHDLALESPLIEGCLVMHDLESLTERRWNSARRTYILKRTNDCTNIGLMTENPTIWCLGKSDSL